MTLGPCTRELESYIECKNINKRQKVSEIEDWIKIRLFINTLRHRNFIRLCTWPTDPGSYLECKNAGITEWKMGTHNKRDWIKMEYVVK